MLELITEINTKRKFVVYYTDSKGYKRYLVEPYPYKDMIKFTSKSINKSKKFSDIDSAIKAMSKLKFGDPNIEICE